MNAYPDVEKILQDAESRLRRIATEALKRGDYAMVRWISGVAQSVADSARSVAPPESASGVWSSHGEPPLVERAAEQTSSPSDAVHPGDREASYPQFFREGKYLVKVGFSRSDRQTYEHRCPRVVLDDLVSLLCEIGASGAKFLTEDLVPPSESRLKDVPVYQTYLCLAFLIRRGLVRKHGRSGYTVEPVMRSNPIDAIGSAWNELSAR